MFTRGIAMPKEQPKRSGTYTGYTEVRKRNNAIYAAKHKRLAVTVTPEQKAKLEKVTKKRGISINKAVIESLRQCGYL